MWLDGIHMSTSVASFEFESIDEGTRFTHVEHGVFFDQFWADGPNRETGSRACSKLWAGISGDTSRDQQQLRRPMGDGPKSKCAHDAPQPHRRGSANTSPRTPGVGELAEEFDVNRSGPRRCGCISPTAASRSW
jgi:hypothetical protein